MPRLARSPFHLPAILRGLVLTIGLCATGCADANRDAAQHEAPLQSLRYYVGKDVVVVEATVTESLGKRIAGDLTLETQLLFRSTEASVYLKTVPDTARAYALDFRAAESDPASRGAGAASAAPAVAVGDDGLLVSPTAQSQSGTEPPRELVTDPSHFPTAPIGGAPSAAHGEGDAAKIEAVFDTTEAGAALKGKPERAEALNRFARLPLPILYVLQESQEARELWDRRSKLDGLIATHFVEKDALLDKLTKLTAKDQIELTRGQGDAATLEIESLRKQRDGADAAFGSAMDRIIGGQGVGFQDHVRKEVATLELTDLPTTDIIKRLSTPAAVEQALAASPKALDLFRHARVVVSVGSVAEFRPPPPAPKPNPANAAQARIYYREAYPAVLDVFAVTLAPDRQQLTMAEVVRQVDQRQVSVTHPRSPVASFVYDPQALAARGLQLAFNRQGRLAGLNRIGTQTTPPGEAAAARSRQQGDASLLARLRGQRKVELEQLQSQIDSLKRQKDMVDAKIVLQGETANPELLTQQMLLHSQITSLTHRQEAVRARALESAGTAGEGRSADVQALVEELRAEIEMLRGRIESRDETRGDTNTDPRPDNAHEAEPAPRTDPPRRGASTTGTSPR